MLQVNPCVRRYWVPNFFRHKGLTSLGRGGTVCLTGNKPLTHLCLPNLVERNYGDTSNPEKKLTLPFRRSSSLRLSGTDTDRFDRLPMTIFLVFQTNNNPISYRIPDKWQYFHFFHPVHLEPQRRGSSLGFCKDGVTRKKLK